MSDDNLANVQRLQLAQFHTSVSIASGTEAMSSVAASHANRRSQTLQENADELRIQVDRLQKQLRYYENLLTRPMHEIAHAVESFRTTYESQQELLATWMVSQRAFKELAIELGLACGKTREDVLAAGMSRRIDVLENSTKHGNDLGNDFYVKPYVDEIKGVL